MSFSPRKEQENLLRTIRLPASFTDAAILNFLSALDHPYSLAIWLLYDNKEHKQLADRRINPADFNDAQDFRDAYTATEFLSKANFLSLDVSREDEAFKKFFEYEEKCRSTNRRFSNLNLDPLYQGANVWLLNATIRKIDQILGDISGEEFVDNANWGPGVSTKVKGTHVSGVNKFQSETGITGGLYSLVSDWFHVAYPHWIPSRTLNGEKVFSIEAGNKIVTVPKNSKTDRVIAIEPGYNIWFQKSLGTSIRKRLQREGIDLNSQARNQQLALEGSRDSLLATVDFSSASDSISRNLVRELLPTRWITLMDACRSPVGFHNNQVIVWEKYSSMGNGFTFELESLIFYAAALAVREYLCVSGEISVYGDDVIIPVTCYDLFASFSNFLGFTVNRRKSFSSGYFRESCGSHYFDAIDCKPIFLKEKISNVQAVYKLANRVRDYAHRCRSFYGCDSRFLRSWLHLFRRVPRTLQFQIPAGYGDSGFIVNFDEATPAKAARGGIEGYLVRVALERGVIHVTENDALRLARYWANNTSSNLSSKMPGLRSAKRFQSLPRSHARQIRWFLDDVSSDVGYENEYTLRGRTRISISEILISQWYNLGPWS